MESAHHCHDMAVIPEFHPVTVIDPEPCHVTANLPEPCHASAVTLEPFHATIDESRATRSVTNTAGIFKPTLKSPCVPECSGRLAQAVEVPEGAVLAAECSEKVANAADSLGWLAHAATPFAVVSFWFMNCLFSQLLLEIPMTNCLLALLQSMILKMNYLLVQSWAMSLILTFLNAQCLLNRSMPKRIFFNHLSVLLQ